MRYVLDACDALKWVLPEPDSAIALRLRDDFRNGVHELLAPDVFPAEVGHALAKAERRGIIPAASGAPRLADVLRTLPQLFPSLPDLLPRAYAIASQARIGVYDCLYVALAEREGCELVTADDRLVRNLQARFPFIVPLASLPSPP
jgi:predicted nucleic acid-binding protein